MALPRVRQSPEHIAASAPRGPRAVAAALAAERDPADLPGGVYQFVEDGSCVVIPYATFGLTGSGFDDAKLINEAIGQAGPYGKVRLIPGANYSTYTPIAFPATTSAGVTLDGGVWNQATSSDFAGLATSAGTIIRPAATFAGAAVITQATTTAAYMQGMHLRDFTIEGNALPAASGIHGIQLTGGLATGSMHWVMVHRPDGDCLRISHDPAGGLDPDDWFIDGCKFSASRSSHGVNNTGSSFADSVFLDCEASENALDNWLIGFSSNLRLDCCRGENSAGGAGFHLAGAGSLTVPVMLTGCSAQFNNQDGFLFTGGASTYLLTGCRSQGDGAAGGATFAGFRANGSSARVILNGCVALKNAGGTVPAYGASETGTSFEVWGNGCWLEGATAATHDDGTNTHALVSNAPVPF